MVKKKTKPVARAKKVSFKEHSKQQRDKASQPRRLRVTASKAKKPAGKLRDIFSRALRPFRFLLWPLSLSPVRFVLRTLAKVLFINYFIASFNEVRQVNWPTRSETFKLTTAVIMFATVFAVIISIADFFIDKVLRQIII